VTSSTLSPTNSTVSSTSAQLYELAQTIFLTVTDTHYQHVRQPAAAQVTFAPDGKTCQVHSDCSGWVSYLLDKVAPAQYQAILSLRPWAPHALAEAFAHFFQQLQQGAVSPGWEGIKSVHDLRQGDLVAWVLAAPPSGPRGNTGHVMIVADQPVVEVAPDTQLRFLSVPVIDCSSVWHFPPEQLPPLAAQTARDGVGNGCVRIVLDANDNPIAYWEGTYSGEKKTPILGPEPSSVISFARLGG